jgi:hypothetical protein
MSANVAGQPDIKWVYATAQQEIGWYGDPQASPLVTGPGLFGPSVTAESLAALSEAWPGVTLATDVTTIRADPSALECSAYLGGAAVLHLSAPRAMLNTQGAYLVEVNVDHGCQGEIYDLEISAGQAGYSVQLLQQSSWIV